MSTVFESRTNRWRGAAHALSAVVVAVCAGAIAVALPACAKKTVEPGAAVVPRYPDFVFPTVPPGVGTPETAALLDQGWRSLQAGDFNGAAQTFDKAVRVAPSFYPAATGLAYVRLAERSHDAAIRGFDGVLRANAGYVPALVGRGDALLAASRPQEALASFRDALARDPSLTAVRQRVEVLDLRLQQEAIGAARRAADAGRYDEARRAYQQAIASSPSSAFLYRDLASVEQLAGDQSAALQHAKQATDLDPADARAWVLLGDLLEASKSFDDAVAAYARAAELEPGPAAAARLDRVRRELAISKLPPEFQHITDAAQATRADVAALVGLRLRRLLERATPRDAVVITDVRGHWAASWIQAVTRAGVMDPYPNHEFQPDAPVRRADLAGVASRLLQLIGASDPKRYRAWQQGRPAIADIPAENVNYAAIAAVVTAGVMPLADGGAFLPARPVSGAEALEVLARVEVLSR